MCHFPTGVLLFRSTKFSDGKLKKKKKVPALCPGLLFSIQNSSEVQSHNQLHNRNNKKELLELFKVTFCSTVHVYRGGGRQDGQRSDTKPFVTSQRVRFCTKSFFLYVITA